MSKRTFVPKRKLSGGVKMYRKWEDYDIGDIVIGKYTDTHTDQYGKLCWVIEVYDAQFKDKSGSKYVKKNLVLNAAGMLDKAMKKLELGEVIQAEYQGTSVIEKGKFAGKDSHVIEVQLCEEGESDPEL